MEQNAYSYGGIIIALIALLTKLWLDQNKRTDQMIEAFKENAATSTKLSTAIEANTQLTKETKEAAFEHNKNITVLIAKVVAQRKSKHV